MTTTKTNKFFACYRQLLREYGTALPVFIGVMLALMLLGFALSYGQGGEGTFSGMGLISAIFIFVAGVGGLRSDIRLCVQFGASRRTALLAEALAAVTASALLALAGELMNLLCGLLSAVLHTPMASADLYAMVYLGGDTAAMNSFGAHAASALLVFVLLLAMFTFGAFFTLLFWNLRGIGIVAGGISIPVVVNGVLWLLSLSGGDKILLGFWQQGALAFGGSCILFTVVFAAIDWLLLSHANLRAPAK